MTGSRKLGEREFAVAGLTVLGGGVLGSLVGYAIGDATCNEDEYAILRCLEEHVAGLGIGLVSGLLVGLLCALIWMARLAAREGLEVRHALRVAVALVAGLAIGGVLVGFNVAGRGPDGGRELLVELPNRAAQVVFVHSENLSDELDDDLHVLDGLGFQTTVVKDAHHPAWSPDGKQIAFERAVDVRNNGISSEPHDIWVVNADGTGERRLTDHAKIGTAFGGVYADNTQPDWSPDGKRIAFASGRGGIYVMNTDGTDLRRLTTGDADDRAPTWSPDGRWIAFSSSAEDESVYSADLWVVRTDGSRRRPLTQTAKRYEGAPDWSPDGRTIAYQGKNGIWSVNADGSGARRLTRQPNEPSFFYCDCGPDWSPDGRWIAFARIHAGPVLPGTSGIWIMDADGRNLQQVTEGDDSDPTWKPPRLPSR